MVVPAVPVAVVVPAVPVTVVVLAVPVAVAVIVLAVGIQEMGVTRTPNNWPSVIRQNRRGCFPAGFGI